MRQPTLPSYTSPESAATVERRFWAKTVKTDACWDWVGTISKNGYGRLTVNGSGGYILAHRLAYELLVDAIPDGLTIDHLCRNRSCVNPSHMEVVTHKENTLRGTSFSAQNAQRTHCIRGHVLEGHNLFWFADGRKRGCVACRRLRSKRYWRQMTPEQLARRNARKRTLAAQRREVSA